MLKLVTMCLQVLGWLIFAIATITLGSWLRRCPTKKSAETARKILHTAFWLGVIPPTGLGIFNPGWMHFDEVLGLAPLPRHSILSVIGVLMVFAGVYLFVASNIILRLSGKGAHAFLLTKNVVRVSVYSWSRNPMSLGFYLWSVGGGLVIGSTYWTFGALLFVIPVHIFYLKYFEESELALRLGQPYLDYRQKVPSLFPDWVFHRS